MAEYAVQVTPDLKVWLQALKSSADKDAKCAKATMYRSIRRCFDELFAVDPFHPTLVLTGNLARVGRAKSGRLRIFFLASRQLKRVVVLMIGNRKDGDPNDAYTVFTDRVRQGLYDPQFVELGVPKPTV